MFKNPVFWRRHFAQLQAANGAALSAGTIFLVTTVHHVYGAYVYNTPWRIHAAIVSGLTTVVIWTLLSIMRRSSGGRVSRVTSRLFLLLTFLIPFLGFGVFEGAYNHVLKLALYFAHASPGVMRRLFPPPAYEMPNNVVFEATGVLQVVPGFLTGYYLYQFVCIRQRGLAKGGIAECERHF